MVFAAMEKGKRMKNPRYETCIQCGEKWNVSAHAKLFRGKYYICPKCENKNRRAGK